MNYLTTDSHNWPYDDIGEMCEDCGSIETFDTFDGKRVCRSCCHVETVHPRPVNVITAELVRSQKKRCPYCKSDEVKHYVAHWCCYGCGRDIPFDVMDKYMTNIGATK